MLGVVEIVEPVCSMSSSESAKEFGGTAYINFRATFLILGRQLKLQRFIKTVGFVLSTSLVWIPAISAGAQSTVSPQAPRLTVAPARPDPGAIVRLTLSAVPSSADKVAAV